jgi:hypothetical protein
MTTKEQRIAEYRDLIHKASTDLEFRKALLGDPAAVLKAEGWSIPDTMEVRVVENTDELMYVTLPALALLTDEEMGDVQGGAVSMVSSVSKVSTVSKVSIRPQ